MDAYKLLDLYKAAIDERGPFEGKVLTQLKGYYRIRLTWSSNALEGNTLTESGCFHQRLQISCGRNKTHTGGNEWAFAYTIMRPLVQGGSINI